MVNPVGFSGAHLVRYARSVSWLTLATKGFTEALISDLRINAPHIKCSVVMPGQYLATGGRAALQGYRRNLARPLSALFGFSRCSLRVNPVF